MQVREAQAWRSERTEVVPFGEREETEFEKLLSEVTLDTTEQVGEQILQELNAENYQTLMTK